MSDITTVRKIRDELDINIEHVMIMGNLFDREAVLLEFANAVEKSQQAEIARLNAIIKENEADKWINVDDRLPDYQSVTQKRLRVLVFWKKTNAVFTLWYGSRFGHTKANFYEENDWDEGSDGLIDDNLYFGDTLTFKNITHWQPLPQPPAMRVKGE
jgi:hypothetical protein